MTVVLALVAALLFALGNVLQRRLAMSFPDRLANSSLFLVRPARHGVKAALVGAAAGVVFGLHGALVKAMVAGSTMACSARSRAGSCTRSSPGRWVGMTLSQISLQAGDLPPSIATQSIATPIVGVVLGETLFEEAIHDTTAGVVASVGALAGDVGRERGARLQERRRQ